MDLQQPTGLNGCGDLQRLRRNSNNENFCCFTAICNKHQGFSLCTTDGSNDTCKDCPQDKMTGMTIDTITVDVQFNACVQPRCLDNGDSMNCMANARDVPSENAASSSIIIAVVSILVAVILIFVTMILIIVYLKKKRKQRKRYNKHDNSSDKWSPLLCMKRPNGLKTSNRSSSITNSYAETSVIGIEQDILVMKMQKNELQTAVPLPPRLHPNLDHIDTQDHDSYLIPLNEQDLSNSNPNLRSGEIEVTMEKVASWPSEGSSSSSNSRHRNQISPHPLSPDIPTDQLVSSGSLWSIGANMSTHSFKAPSDSFQEFSQSGFFHGRLCYSDDDISRPFSLPVVYRPSMEETNLKNTRPSKYESVWIRRSLDGAHRISPDINVPHDIELLDNGSSNNESMDKQPALDDLLTECDHHPPPVEEIQMLDTEFQEHMFENNDEQVHEMTVLSEIFGTVKHLQQLITQKDNRLKRKENEILDLRRRNKELNAEIKEKDVKCNQIHQLLKSIEENFPVDRNSLEIRVTTLEDIDGDQICKGGDMDLNVYYGRRNTTIRN